MIYDVISPFLKLTGHASCIIFELHCAGSLLAQRFGYRSASGHSPEVFKYNLLSEKETKEEARQLNEIKN